MITPQRLANQPTLQNPLLFNTLMRNSKDVDPDALGRSQRRAISMRVRAEKSS